MKYIELLSPAKNFEVGKAAIDHGADAVYIGAESFGARAAASNSLHDIEKLVNYAHQFYSKVFVTVNTIIYNDELERAEKLIFELYNIGVDAIIIQDMSILLMDLPSIPIHISTQAHNYDFEKIKFFDTIGVDRIVLARELPLSEIKKISQSIKAEIEYFIHGALCVCLSGQCYFSFALTGKSANRGECTQPCRMKYNLLNEKGDVIIKNKHLLSLKDLNLSNYLSDLIDAGVSSFKIEGRLKDIDYVKNTTAFYRKEIDKLINEKLKKASSGVIYHFFEPDLNKTFNRTYTNYFFDGKRKKIANFNTPKSLGEKIGKIIKIEKNYFIVENGELLKSGDGICFYDKSSELVGFYINKIIDRKIYFPNNIKPVLGTFIYRNYDQDFVSHLNKDTAIRKIKINLKVEFKDSKLIVTAIDEDNNCIQNFFKIDIQKAKNENQKEYFNEQISRLGNTIFEINNIENNLPEDLFIPASIIKQIKNKIVDDLLITRKQNYPKEKTRYNKNLLKDIEIKFAKELNYSYNIANNLSEKFYKIFGAELIEPAFELQKNFVGKLLMTTKYCIRYELDQCPKYNLQSNNQNLFLENNGNLFKLVFDCKNCLMKIYYEKAKDSSNRCK